MEEMSRLNPDVDVSVLFRTSETAFQGAVTPPS
jgi:hypothetical protein